MARESELNRDRLRDTGQSAERIERERHRRLQKMTFQVARLERLTFERGHGIVRITAGVKGTTFHFGTVEATSVQQQFHKWAVDHLGHEIAECTR
jgi:hypothetical protein